MSPPERQIIFKEKKMKALKAIGLVLLVAILIAVVFVGVEAVVSMFNGLTLKEQLKYALINIGDFLKRPFIK